MNTMTEQIAAFWNQAITIWLSGGWGMIALVANALVMMALGMHVLFKLREKQFHRVPERIWRHWINHSNERRGPIGKLLDFVTGANSLKQSSVFFQELRSTEIIPFERDLKVMKVCVAAAPLLGLLGTVTGMLSTFGALASGSGGEKTMGLVAEGISEALITTETGLVIALPGLFFQYLLSRKLESYRVFLSHLETICTQKLHKNLIEQEKNKHRTNQKVITYRPRRKQIQIRNNNVRQKEKVA